LILIFYCIIGFCQTAEKFNNFATEKAKLKDYQGAISDYSKTLEKFTAFWFLGGDTDFKYAEYNFGEHSMMVQNLFVKIPSPCIQREVCGNKFF